MEGIKDTDGGDNVTLEQRKAIDGSILQLEAIGAEQQVCQRRRCAASCGSLPVSCLTTAPLLWSLHPQPRPLANDLIFGNYNVAYVSAGKSQYGQPAGGRFRSSLGKFIFQTTDLCQSVLRPDVVVNKVRPVMFWM